MNLRDITARDYINNVSVPAQLEVSGDRDLYEGGPVLIKHQGRSKKSQEPWSVSGANAIVFKYRLRTGELCALRALKRPLNPDEKDHLVKVDAALQQTCPQSSARHPLLRRGIEDCD